MITNLKNFILIKIKWKSWKKAKFEEIEGYSYDFVEDIVIILYYNSIKKNYTNQN